MRCGLNEIHDFFTQGDNFTILCHRRPDGDTLGSALALYYTLVAQGKRARVLCSDPFPKKYAYMYAGYADVCDKNSPELVVAVDVASAELLGDLKEQFEGRIDLCIDHHPTNSLEAKLSYVDSRAAAAAEIMFDVLCSLGVCMDTIIGECIYTGIATDTGCFLFSNTSPGALRIAADLLEMGVETSVINTNLFRSKAKSKVKLEAAVMQGIEYFCGGKAAMTAVTEEMKKEYGIGEDAELENIPNLAKDIEGVKFAVTIKEFPGYCSVSVRTDAPYSASDFCARFSGGGHKRAAGCNIEGSVGQAKAILAQAIEEFLG